MTDGSASLFPAQRRLDLICPLYEVERSMCGLFRDFVYRLELGDIGVRTMSWPAGSS